MSQNTQHNRQFLLASRPHGQPQPDNFRLNLAPIPTPKAGEVLLRTVYLSIDPYMRGRMSDAASYAEPVAIDGLMVGGTVCRVAESQHPDYQVGDWVVAYGGWQDYFCTDGNDLMLKLPSDLAHPSYALGILGMPGFTAYMGLLDIGKPQAGETVVVAAATGPVGATVGQIAKIKGAKAIGIAGGPEKCRHAVEVLGFDACIDHRAPDFAEQLKQACAEGIDVYYENVGGKVFDAVLPLLNSRARIPVCGLISQYNSTELPSGPDRLSLLMGTILTKRLSVRGFIVFDDYGPELPEFMQQMSAWLASGQIKYREQLVDGFEQAPQALIDVLNGRNFGKMVIQVGPKD
ncbi:MAG: NADP-dependent oxidoreductase [Neisseriaceae bacterium]|nr:NADP-dependent oxidoreductase [Neisseriaceae bacterium]